MGVVGPSSPEQHRRTDRTARRTTRPSDGLRAVVPLLLPVIAFGLSYGVLARDAGFGPAATVVMSATTFAGSAQFAVASVMGAGGATLSAIAAAIMLNARYVPIGVSIAPDVKGPFWYRLFVAHMCVDESWAVSHTPEGRHDIAKLIGAGLGMWVGWVGSTAVGALGADLIGDPNRLGLDAAFPALFLVLLLPRVRDRRAAAVALVGAAIALTLVPVAPAGVPIVAAGAAALIGVRA